jgi:hypothetical protein
MVLRLEQQGYVTRDDFREIGMDRKIWREKWLKRDGSIGRLARYVAVDPKPADWPSNGWEIELEALRNEEGDE